MPLSSEQGDDVIEVVTEKKPPVPKKVTVPKQSTAKKPTAKKAPAKKSAAKQPAVKTTLKKKPADQTSPVGEKKE
jgi:topoisomerase IA-like protein